jgi:hypothetical protein
MKEKTISSINCAEWLRIPAAVAQFGPSRTKLYQLIKEGKVRSVSLREKGMEKATRLIHAGSLRAYIESFEKEGGAE